MSRFPTLECNGRARVVITMALLIPPVLLSALPLFDID